MMAHCIQEKKSLVNAIDLVTERLIWVLEEAESIDQMHEGRDTLYHNLNALVTIVFPQKQTRPLYSLHV